MAKYESAVKQVYSPVESVYAKLSDLTNLAVIKQRFDDPLIQERIAQSGQVKPEQLAQMREAIDNLEFTRDTVTGQSPVGTVSIEIVEREENRCVKFASTNSPVGFKLWIQVLPVTSTTSKMRLTIDADLNFFMKQMIGNKLEEGIDRMADMLAMIPY